VLLIPQDKVSVLAFKALAIKFEDSFLFGQLDMEAEGFKDLKRDLLKLYGLNSADAILVKDDQTLPESVEALKGDLFEALQTRAPVKFKRSHRHQRGKMLTLDPESYSHEKLCGKDTPEVCLIALTPRAEEAIKARRIDESEPLITV